MICAGQEPEDEYGIELSILDKKQNHHHPGPER
jgi:hypothetical protein